MTGYLLNLVYLAVLAAASPWLIWSAVRKGKYRTGLAQKFLGWAPVREGGEPCVWFHAVSVGEVKLIGPLVEKLKNGHPHWQIVISTTSATGFALAQKKYGKESVFFAPLDFTWSVGTAVRRVRPDLLVLAELELWPNLLSAARRRGAKIAVVNGRLSERSFRGYSRIRRLIARVLRGIDLLAVQNEEHAERFLSLGATPERVCVTGSLKFDGAETDRHNPRTTALRKLAGLSESDVVFLAGSTQAPEEALALDVFCKLSPAHPNLRLILVPRHPERFDEVARMLDLSKLPWVRRSQLDNSTFPNLQVPTSNLLLVDTIGELADWWGLADIAYVGGSLGSRGGQNMIEPAAFGAAVCFGPRTENFRDVVQALLSHEAAVEVQDSPDLASFVLRCLEEPAFAPQLGTRASQLVQELGGATEQTIGLLESLFLDQDKSQVRRFAA